MSLTVGELNAVLGLEDGPFDRGLNRSEKRFGRFGSFLAGAAKKAAIGTAAALGGGAAAGVGTFASLERGMNEVFTLMPGVSRQAMGKMTGQVKDFATEFGTLPNEVVPALYQSLSAGVPPDNVFDFMETAQQAAIGGVTDLSTAVDGITSVVNAYGDQIGGAAEASDLMFTAVRLGKTDFGQLSRSLFNVIPTASALGVEFSDVTAAMAAMTAQGTPTSVATTQMRQLLVELSKEGTATSETFEEIAGKSFREFIDGGGNVEGALQMMAGEAAKSGGSISDMFGSVEAGSAALSLTSAKGAELFSGALDEMADSAGATEGAYDQMDQGISRSFDRIKSAGAVALSEVGESLAPLVASMAGFAEDTLPVLAEQVGPAIADALQTANMVIQTSIGLWNDFKVPILVVAGVLLASYIPALLAATKAKVVSAATQVKAWALTRGAALKSIATQTAAMAKLIARYAWMGVQSLLHAGKIALSWLIAMGPIALVIAAVVGLVALIVTNWDTIKRVIAAGWDWVKRKTSQFVSLVVAYVRDLKDRAIAFISSVVDFVRRYHPIMILWRLAKEWVPKVIDKVRDLKDRVIGFFTGAKGWLADAGRNLVRGLWSGITGMGSWLVSKITSFVADKIPGPIRKALGISSPSKVAAELARQVPRGMMVGMESEASALARAAERMAMQALPRLNVPAVDGRLSGAAAAAGAGGAMGGPTYQIYAPTTAADDLIRAARDDEWTRQRSPGV